MTEPAPAQEPQQTEQPADGAPVSETPPWGDDFDPARAWHTIQTLREAEKERDQLRKQVVTPEQREQLEEYGRLIEASKSEQQRKDEQLAAVSRERDTTAADALRYRIAIEHGVSKDDLDLLGSGTEEELAARAQRIAELHAKAARPADPPPSRNGPALPGATPPPPPEADDVEARYRSYFPATQ